MEFLIKRGDIVTCALSGDYGKPRPAVVVQSDLFNKTWEKTKILFDAKPQAWSLTELRP